MPGSASFSWIGTTNGTWDSPTNWADLTTGQTPAVVVPGSLDVVAFGNSGSAAAVSGSGSAASITMQGLDAVLGALNTGTLVVTRSDSLQLSGAITGATVTDVGTIAVTGSAGTLAVTIGNFDVGGTKASSALLVENRGTLITDSATTIDATGTDQATAMISAGTWDALGLGPITVGNAGAGSLDINNNGLVRAADVQLGNQAGGAGTISLESGGTLLAGDLGMDVAPLGGASGSLRSRVGRSRLTF